MKPIGAELNLETKTISTPAGDLPLSPLMDPTFHEARSLRYKTPKEKPQRGHPLQKWQKLLRRNPYGMYLIVPYH